VGQILLQTNFFLIHYSNWKNLRGLGSILMLRGR
jgi:hypothetical protein